METMIRSTFAEEDDRLTGCDGRYLATLVGRTVNVRIEKRSSSLGEGMRLDVGTSRVQSVTHERTEDAYKTVVRFEDGGSFSVHDWTIGLRLLRPRLGERSSSTTIRTSSSSRSSPRRCRHC